VYDESRNNLLYKRKSPQKKAISDVAHELVGIVALILHPQFELEVFLTKEQEIRCKDGQGSWRRKGISIVDRKMTEVIERVVFAKKMDYLILLPAGLPKTFTNKILAQHLATLVKNARRLTYCLKAAGLLEVIAKEGRSYVYTITKQKKKRTG
jgi:hypothetical protein